MKRLIRASKSAPLYHGTTWNNAIKILESNELRANVSNETETYGVSFTRNKEEAYDQVVFVIDQELLSYNYKIEPVYRDGISGRDLAEERVDRTIRNFRKYIISVKLSHRLIVKRIKRGLNSDDTRVLTDPKFDPNPRYQGYGNEVYEANKFIETINKYNIPRDSLLNQIEQMIDDWKIQHNFK